MTDKDQARAIAKEGVVWEDIVYCDDEGFDTDTE